MLVNYILASIFSLGNFLWVCFVCFLKPFCLGRFCLGILLFGTALSEIALSGAVVSVNLQKVKNILDLRIDDRSDQDR